ncbi:shikimate kinase [Urechidicola sp. KH5]
MKIVLIGYMASGKSAIGIELANTMQLPLIDLDSYIEAKEKMTISKIFEDKGEIYFRVKETTYLKQLLEETTNAIISVGGGTPCYGTNMNIIIEKSTPVYLKTGIKTLHDRLIKEKAHRPLVASIKDEDLMEFIGKHLFERTPFYEKSKAKVITDSKSIKEIVAEIQKLLS